MKMSNNLLTLTAINKDLGEDFDNIIVKCRERRKVLLETNRDITVKIKSKIDGGQSNMLQTLSKVHEERLEIISLRKKVEQLKFEYAKFKEDNENIKVTFQNLIKDLKYKCNRYTYFTCIQCVSSKSNKIKKYSSSKHDNEAIMAYTILCKLSFAMNDTQCKHLVSYINKIINYWHCILEQYYSEDFKIVLKQINWPFTMTKSIDVGKLETFKHNFQYLANMLLKIDLFKNNIDDMQTTSHLMEHFTHVSTPISILIIPFRKRFLFHFTGKKQTNKADKPEWYLSRVLSWIRDYRSFFLEWLGPIYEENNKNPIDSQNEFIIGLLQSVVMKIDSDLSYFELEDMVFCHIVDETLTFEHELGKVYGYPNNYPNVTEVLIQPHIFLKWISLERKYANAKIDVIMLNKDEWKVLVNDNAYCLISCADNFLTLLNTMSDRYNILRQPRHKLQFLKLQIDLLQEFKEKIIEYANVINQSNEHLIQILCILHYVSYTLNNWGTNVHFLSLLNSKCELVKSLHESDDIIIENVETVFDESIELYNLAIDNLINILCDNIIDKVKIHSKPYKRDKWHVMNSLPDENKYNITDSGWIMYETFADNLNILNKNLPNLLFNKCWPKLTTKLSTFIFNEILLSNMFNKGGSQHLFCDVQYKLLPIISKYTIKPTMYIERLLEACKVLCCQPNVRPIILTRHEISEILLRRIEHGNSMDIE